MKQFFTTNPSNLANGLAARWNVVGSTEPLPIFPAKSPESWRQSTTGRKRVLENELYELIEESAKDLNVKLIDAYTPMKNDSKLTSDGVHFKDAGYKKLAAIIHK